MKKCIGLICALTLVLLYVTNSVYVEWTEIWIIIGSLSLTSIVYNLFSKRAHGYAHVLGSSAIIGFFLSILFILVDLVLDHYKLLKTIPDGRFLTIAETISEFTDDTVILVLIAICSVTFISFVITVICSKLTRKTA